MPSYQIKKISSGEYHASREGVEGHFTLIKVLVGDKHLWQMYTPQHIMADHDSSRTALINRLEKGEHDAFLISEFNMGKWVAKVNHRSTLIQGKTGEEGFDPLNVIHWWKKGDYTHPFYKCDLHTQNTSVEGIGDTLPEALNSLKTWFNFCEND